MRLTDFYCKLLTSLGLTVDDDGLVSKPLGKNNRTVPVTLKNTDTDEQLRLVVPLRERLRAGDWNGVIAFHPLSESVLNGESDILVFLRKRMESILTARILIILDDLMLTATDPAAQKTLTKSAQIDFFHMLKHADEKTYDALMDIIGRSKGQRKVLKLFVQRPGEIGDEKFSRGAYVRFPLELKEDESGKMSMWGVPLRKNSDAKAIPLLLDYVTGGEKDMFSVGSNASAAPFLMALLEAYVKYATHINNILITWKGVIGTDIDDDLLLDLDWQSELSTLGGMAKDIPPLEGNEGPVIISERKRGTVVQRTVNVDEEPVETSSTVAQVPTHQVAAPVTAQTTPFVPLGDRVASPAPQHTPVTQVQQAAPVAQPSVSATGKATFPIAAPQQHLQPTTAPVTDQLGREIHQNAAGQWILGPAPVLQPATAPVTDQLGREIHQDATGQWVLGPAPTIVPQLAPALVPSFAPQQQAIVPQHINQPHPAAFAPGGALHNTQQPAPQMSAREKAMYMREVRIQDEAAAKHQQLTPTLGNSHLVPQVNALY